MEESRYIDRRRFLIRTATGSLAACAGLTLPAHADKAETKITILHTNDVHSRIDPFEKEHPDFPGQGGAARRSWLINKIRSECENVLVFDSGDIFQGTPYFNLFKGKPEIQLMNHMSYQAATIGNHEFDAGLLNLSERIREASFPFVCSNYDFEETPLKGLTLPWKIITIGPLRIGIVGLGIELQGLVDSALYGASKYIDPLLVGNRISSYLKARKKCSLVIALSHLGYSYKNSRVSDKVLAENTSDIDIILGGHTHTFLDEPVTVKNKSGHDVLICQCGWGGVKLGRIDLTFRKNSSGKSFFVSLI